MLDVSNLNFVLVLKYSSMNKFVISISLFCLILNACAQGPVKDNKEDGSNNEIVIQPGIGHTYALVDYLTENTQLDKDVDSIFNTLDNHSRIAHLLMPAVGRLGLTNEEISEQVKKNLIGGVILLNGSKEEFSMWIKSYNALNPLHKSLPFLYSADAEPTLFNRKISGSTQVKKANEIKTQEEVIDCATTISNDLNAIGINYNFAPVVDVSKNSTVGYRGFGAIPSNIIPWSNAFIKTTQDLGIIATAKHFPGHGLVSGDTHKSLQMIEGELKEISNYPPLIENGLLSIMVAHIAVLKNKKYNTNGLPATASSEIVQKLLREELKFKGLIVTDAMNMGGISSLIDAEVKVIEAGCDIVLMPLDVEKSHAKLLAKYTNDLAFQKKVDAAVKRIMRMKLCLAKG
jgi:beta-N-acetylhexosaminidase